MKAFELVSKGHSFSALKKTSNILPLHQLSIWKYCSNPCNYLLLGSVILVSAFFEFRRDLAVREERRRELDFLEKVVVILVSHCLHTLTMAKSFLTILVMYSI